MKKENCTVGFRIFGDKQQNHINNRIENSLNTKVYLHQMKHLKQNKLYFKNPHVDNIVLLSQVFSLWFGTICPRFSLVSSDSCWNICRDFRTQWSHLIIGFSLLFLPSGCQLIIICGILFSCIHWIYPNQFILFISMAFKIVFCFHDPSYTNA